MSSGPELTANRPPEPAAPEPAPEPVASEPAAPDLVLPDRAASGLESLPRWAVEGESSPRRGGLGEPPWPLRGRLLAGAVCAIVMAVAGLPLGLLWSLCAPALDVEAVLDGAVSVFAVQSTVDAYFALICLVAGVIGGLVAYWRAADAGWPVPVGLAAGGTAGSLLAGWVGQWRRSDEALAALPPNATDLLRELAEFHVRATGLYLVLPGAAVLVLTLALWAAGTSPGWSLGRRGRRSADDGPPLPAGPPPPGGREDPNGAGPAPR